jgi:hypothetical protein
MVSSSCDLLNMVSSSCDLLNMVPLPYVLLHVVPFWRDLLIGSLFFVVFYHGYFAIWSLRYEHYLAQMIVVIHLSIMYNGKKRCAVFWSLCKCINMIPVERLKTKRIHLVSELRKRFCSSIEKKEDFELSHAVSAWRKVFGIHSFSKMERTESISLPS